MRVLLDTCVISEFKKKKPCEKVCQVVADIPDASIFISVITTGELIKGISLLKESKQKKDLQKWFKGLNLYYQKRMLAIDNETSHIWGELTAAAQKNGVVVPASDGLIAATARRHGLCLMTRDVSHFKATGVELINPWK